MRKARFRLLNLTYLLFFIFTPQSYGQKRLSFYTTVEILREKKVDYHQKKRWIMLNILSLDENENSNSHFVKKKLIEKKFSKYQEGQKKKKGAST